MKILRISHLQDVFSSLLPGHGCIQHFHLFSCLMLLPLCYCYQVTLYQVISHFAGCTHDSQGTGRRQDLRASPLTGDNAHSKMRNLAWNSKSCAFITCMFSLYYRSLPPFSYPCVSENV